MFESQTRHQRTKARDKNFYVVILKIYRRKFIQRRKEIMVDDKRKIKKQRQRLSAFCAISSFSVK